MPNTFYPAHSAKLDNPAGFSGILPGSIKKL